LAPAPTTTARATTSVASTTSTVAPTTTEAETVDTEARVRVAIRIAPGQWDPHNGRAPFSDYMWYQPVYDKLLALDLDFNVQPRLATEWTLSDDGLTFDMELRDGVTFHDGTPFDAEAVKANLDYARTLQGTTAANELAIIESVEVTGPLSVRVTLKSPGTLFPVTLAFSAASSSMVSPAALADPATLATTPVGTGPYKVASVTEAQVVYERLPDHWDAENTPHLPKEIEINFMGDPNARLNALRSGQIDVALVESPMLENVAQEVEDEELQYVAYETTGAKLAMLLNLTKPPLDDPRVREAIGLAVDREGLAEVVSPDACIPTLQPFLEGAPGYIDSLEAEAGDHYDVERATQLLAEAGVSGLTLNVAAPASPHFVDTATILQAMLGEVGINLSVTQVPAAQVRGDWRAGKYDAFVGQLTNLPDPQFAVDLYMRGPDGPGGPTPGVAPLIDPMLAQEYGSPGRASALEDITNAFVADNHHLIICTEEIGWLATPNVTGLDNMPLSRMNSLVEPLALGMVE
jgi:peptide/nickel transport system substrate-binding protein